MQHHFCAGAAKETRELIAEILAKFEKEALIIDGVHAAIKDLQERVLAEQGEEGTGLRGNPRQQLSPV